MTCRLFFLLLHGLLVHSYAQAEEVFAVVDAAWVKDVGRALACDIGGDGSTSVAQDVPAQACANGSIIFTVQNSSNTTNWEDAFAYAVTTAQSRTVHPILLGVGRGVLEPGNAVDIAPFSRVVAMPTENTGQEKAHLCWYIECVHFQVWMATFLSAAGAALLPWTSRVFAVLTDKDPAGQDVTRDETFKAFINGVNYIDPSIRVVRFRWHSDAPLQSENRKEGLKLEVNEVLKRCPVMLLDLTFPSDVEAALTAMQANYERYGSSRPSRAIVPAFFESFVNGTVNQRWRSVLLDGALLDVERAVLDVRALGKQYSNRILKMSDAYVSSLWFKKTVNVSRWPLGRAGTLPEATLELLDQPCGESNIKTYLNETVLDLLEDHIDDIDSALCAVKTDCCQLLSSPMLAPTQNLLPPVCTGNACPEEFKTQAGHISACGGSEFTSRTCPATGSATLMGIGVSVGNLANVDLSTGSFYVDMNVYLFEFKNKVEPTNFSEATSPFCQSKLEFASPVAIMTAADFSDYVTFVGMDRWASITPTQNGQEFFTNVKANVFFRTEVKTWPLDTQNLSIVMDATGDHQLEFCVLREYTALQTDIRFPGVSRKSMFDVLTLDSAVTRVCFSPYTYPDNYCKEFIPSWGSDLLCKTCAYPVEEDDGLPADVTCKCMGGAKPASRSIFKITFKRPYTRLAYVVFFPPLAIMMVNQGVLWLKISASTTRLSTCTSGLLSTVMYHITVMDSTPSTAQEQTKADHVMTLCYAGNIFVWFTALAQYLAYASDRDSLSDWANDSFYFKARVFCPLLMTGSVLWTLYASEVQKIIGFLMVTWVAAGLFMLLDFRISLLRKRKMERLVADLPMMSRSRSIRHVEAYITAMRSQRDVEEDDFELARVGSGRSDQSLVKLSPPSTRDDQTSQAPDATQSMGVHPMGEMMGETLSYGFGEDAADGDDFANRRTRKKSVRLDLSRLET